MIIRIALTSIVLYAILSPEVPMNAINTFSVVIDDEKEFRRRLKKLAIMISADKGESVLQGEVLKMGLEKLEKIYLK